MLSCGKVVSSEVVCLQTLKALLKKRAHTLSLTHIHTHTHTHKARLAESGVREIEFYSKLDSLQQNSSSVNNFHFLSAINHTTAKLLPVLQYVG
jgi:hypothetical protein